MAGWWLTYPFEKYEFVSWDDDIPSMEQKIHVPNQILPGLLREWESHHFGNSRSSRVGRHLGL